MQRNASSLAETLRRRRFEAMQGDAELTRDYPEGEERTAEAERLIREAMYDQALGRITMDERDRILGILSFAAAGLWQRDTPTDPPLSE